MAQPGICGDCLALNSGDARGGICKRHPPQLLAWVHPDLGMQIEAHQPYVQMTDGCLDFVPAQEGQGNG